MKKYLNLSMAYAIAAMAGGVFYREFTKWNGFTGVTALGKVHTHLFMLGMIMFLIVALFAERYPLSEQKTFRMFVRVYNMGVPVTSLMMAVRGITQVLGPAIVKRGVFCNLRYCRNWPYSDRSRDDPPAFVSQKSSQKGTINLYVFAAADQLADAEDIPEWCNVDV